jgi:hypothetical protein
MTRSFANSDEAGLKSRAGSLPYEKWDVKLLLGEPFDVLGMWVCLSGSLPARNGGPHIGAADSRRNMQFPVCSFRLTTTEVFP